MHLSLVTARRLLSDNCRLEVPMYSTQSNLTVANRLASESPYIVIIPAHWLFHGVRFNRNFNLFSEFSIHETLKLCQLHASWLCNTCYGTTCPLTTIFC